MGGNDPISADVCNANRKAERERIKALEGRTETNEENISDLYDRTERPSWLVASILVFLGSALSVTSTMLLTRPVPGVN
jgi:hypothetical protein